MAIYFNPYDQITISQWQQAWKHALSQGQVGKHQTYKPLFEIMTQDTWSMHLGLKQNQPVDDKPWIITALFSGE